MNLIRNDRQVALNDLLVASNKSADHYRDAADFLDPLPRGAELRRIATERDNMVKRLEQAVRSAGDLPSAPDEDRESVEKFYHRVHASMAEDEIRDVLQQRLDAEHEFARIVGDIRSAGWVDDEDELLKDIEQNIQSVIARVEELLEDYST